MSLNAVLRYKKTLIGFGFLVILLGALVLSLPTLIQSQAPAYLLKKSGHVLALGKPEIHVFHMQLSLPTVDLRTPEGEKLLSFEDLAVDLKGTSLFKGLIELDSVKLNGLDLNVALLPDGKLNWSALIEALKSPEPEPPSEPPSFRLDRLSVQNARVGIEDRRGQTVLKTSLEPLNIELRDLATRSAESGHFELDAKSFFGADVRLKGQLVLQELNVQGELGFQGLDLAQLGSLIRPLTHTGLPTGTVDFSGYFSLQMPEGKPQVALSELGLEIKALSMAAKPAGPSPSVSLGSLKAFKGGFDLSQSVLGLEGISLQGLNLLDESKSKLLSLDELQLKDIQVDLNQSKATVAQVQLGAGHVNVERNAQAALNLQQWANAWIPPAKTAPADPSHSANPAPPATPAAEASKASNSTAEGKPWAWTVGELGLKGWSVRYADEALKPGFALGVQNIQFSTRNLTEDLSRPLSITSSLDVEGGGSLSASGQVLPAQASADLKLDLSNLSLKPANAFIGDFIKLDLNEGSLSSQGQLVLSPSQSTSYKGSLTVNNLRLDEKGSNKPFLRFKSLSSPQLVASPESVKISRLDLKGLDTQLLIAKDKSTNLSRLLVEKAPTTGAPPSRPAEPVAASNKAAPAFGFSIDRFSIADSEMDFADESLILPFGTRIHTLTGTVTGISNKAGSRSALKINGEVDKFGEAVAEGQLNLLDPTAFMDIKVRFRNVEMTSLTPYSATFAGRKINSGKLSLNLDYNIDKQQLQSNNQVLIDNLQLGERVESPQAANLPLDLAIALLEDSNGRIDLGLPVSGSLSDPQFSYGALVWKALGNVLTKAVSAPFRALGALLGGGSEELVNVAFEPGKGTLSPPQRENLSKLAQALSKRPNLSLELSGTWADADKKAIQAMQLRRAVAQQIGEKLSADEDPGPLALQSANTQKALESIFEKRFGAAELAGLKAGFRQVNPNEAKENLAGQALTGLSNLIRKPRELSASELRSLQGKNLHQLLADRLHNTEAVSTAALEALAQTRQSNALSGLKAGGVPDGRVLAGKVQRVDQTEAQGVPLKIDMIGKTSVKQ